MRKSKELEMLGSLLSIWSLKWKWMLLSCVQLFSTHGLCSSPGSSVHGILQQEYLSGLPRSSPGDLPTQGLNLCFLHYRQILFFFPFIFISWRLITLQADCLSHQGSKSLILVYLQVLICEEGGSNSAWWVVCV